MSASDVDVDAGWARLAELVVAAGLPAPPPSGSAGELLAVTLRAVDDLARRAAAYRAEADALRFELAETNRGLLALHGELSARQVELERARTAAEHASQARSAFVATISHEIRSPMNAVVAFTGLLLETDLTGEQREYAQAVQAAGGHLLGIIDDVLDLSKIESGRLELEEVPFDLYSCVEDAVAIAASKAAEKRLPVAALFAAGIPAVVTGDPLRLRQILVNLLINAVKFTDEGQVSVTVRVAPEGGVPVVTFQVADTGIGIPPDAVPRLFVPFSQADAATAREHGGTGLGLSICRQLADRMGGTIEVLSRPGEGSTFTCAVPIRISDPAPEQADHLLRGQCVLIVYRHPLVAEALRLHLTGWGAEVQLAPAAGHLPPWDGVDLIVLHGDEPDALAADLARLVPGTGAAPPVVAVAPLTIRRTLAETGPVATLVGLPVRRTHLREAVLTALGHPTEPGPAAGPPVLAGTPLRILLADHDQATRRELTVLLDGLGYPASAVDLAGGGREAAQLALRGDYDLVLLNLHMPVCDGVQVTRTIRAHRADGVRPRIVALTVSATVDSRDACAEAGIDDVLVKPVRPEDLARVLRETLGTGNGHRVAVPPATVRVLHVDDDAMTIQLVQRILSSDRAISVHSVTDAGTALTVATADPPDLILLDLNLAGTGGEALLRELRHAAPTASVPIVIISGDTHPATIERLSGAGAARYLTKPFRPAELRRLVATVLRGVTRR